MGEVYILSILYSNNLWVLQSLKTAEIMMTRSQFFLPCYTVWYEWFKHANERP